MPASAFFVLGNNQEMIRLAKGWLALVLLAALSGCATNSLFVSYPSQAQKWKNTLASEAPDQGVITKLEQSTAGGDGVLYLQELGRVTQLNGQPEASRNAFAGAVAEYDKEDASAKIQVSSLASTGTAMLTNDNARPYIAPDYERIFTRAYQALNYWAEGDATGTSVELRAAALEQQVAANKRDKEIAKAEEEADQDGNLNTASGGCDGILSTVATELCQAEVGNWFTPVGYAPSDETLHNGRGVIGNPLQN